MPYEVTRYIDAIVRSLSGLQREHWIAVSVVVLLLGLVCMRGFGSRNNY